MEQAASDAQRTSLRPSRKEPGGFDAGVEPYLIVERSAKDPSQRVLIARVVREGHDRCVQQYIKRGTQEALLADLADEGSLGELMDSIRALSN